MAGVRGTGRFGLTRTAALLWLLYLCGVMLLVAAMTLVTRYVTPVIDARRALRMPPNALDIAAKEAQARGIGYWGGHVYLLSVPTLSRMADNVTGGRSPVLLCEDDRPLGPAHTPHEEIRDLGGGRFSHWGGYVFFSTSDGSDPRTNSRRYRVAPNGRC